MLALRYQALLTQEMSHRVKNSLTSVVGLLRVQARNAQSQDVKSALEDASLRVSTIAEGSLNFLRQTLGISSGDGVHPFNREDSDEANKDRDRT